MCAYIFDFQSILFTRIFFYQVQTKIKMGGAMGNPIDDAAQARINDKIQEVVKTFGTEFSKVILSAAFLY
jgi:lipoprotein signal peptidase